MVKSMLVAALLMTATISCAEPVLLANNSENTLQWWGYPETFVRMTDGYSVMIATRTVNSTEPERRSYYGMKFSDCKKGHGTLYKRDNVDQGWSNDMNVSTSSPVTVSDIVALEICNAFVTLEENYQKQLKKKNTKTKSSTI